ncbi:hypothetical protein Zmor_015418 [Zophobas morio]|uniref:Reverse transcriptase domain-containing protein n=1 Tax=Zophobas morio TaxID=2755281 RepID=A0AA38MHQ4_9CUCU|nr:hypothetical protein Zmor_015418 [Zophobas morio]
MLSFYNVYVEWCYQNRLIINSSKCCYISYCRKLNIVDFSYSIEGTLLERKTSIKDLGVTFDSCLTFDIHLTNICNAANKSLGFVMRTSKFFNNIDVIKSLFFAYVLSKLEYAALIWYPIHMCQHMLLDKVHRKFLKFLSFKIDGNYPARGIEMESLLQRHKMSSLMVRRDLHAANFLCKLIHNKIDCPYLLSQIRFNVPRPASRYVNTFHISTARTNILRRSPITTMCRCADRYVADIFYSN